MNTFGGDDIFAAVVTSRRQHDVTETDSIDKFGNELLKPSGRKGVQVSRRNLANAYGAWEQAYALRSSTTHLQMANFAFDVFTGDVVRALCSGGRLVLCPRDWLLEPASPQR